MELKEYYESIIIQYLQDECSEEDKRNLFLWLEQSVENRQYYFQVKDAWDTRSYLHLSKSIDVNQEWAHFKSSLPAIKKVTVYKENIFVQYNYLIPKIAASLLIILGISWFFLPKKDIPVSAVAENGVIIESVPQGGKLRMVELTDGSKVWLNAGSSLKFPKQFNDSIRKVFLEGEAYFEVTHDALHPFVVDASGIKIKVLGTSFNVMSYGNEGNLETTLVNGSVVIENELAKAENDKSVTLKPNQRMTCTKKTGKIMVDAVENTDEITAWKDGIFLFKSTPLVDLMHRLERHYNVKFVIESPDMLDYKYSGTFEQPASITRAMEILEYTYPIHFEVDGNVVKLSKKK